MKSRFIKYVASDTASFFLQSETMRIYDRMPTTRVGPSYHIGISSLMRQGRVF
jgi:hypothetical protein